ncbi:MAG: hypothetical protein ABL986_08835 [Vicinamibacterales bacterium]
MSGVAALFIAIIVVSLAIGLWDFLAERERVRKSREGGHRV